MKLCQTHFEINPPWGLREPATYEPYPGSLLSEGYWGRERREHFLVFPMCHVRSEQVSRVLGKDSHKLQSSGSWCWKSTGVSWKAWGMRAENSGHLQQDPVSCHSSFRTVTCGFKFFSLVLGGFSFLGFVFNRIFLFYHHIFYQSFLKNFMFIVGKRSVHISPHVAGTKFQDILMYTLIL